MKWLSPVLSFFSNSETQNDIFDKDNGHLTKLGGWVDELGYGDQEKAEGQLEMLKAVRQHAVDTLEENTQRSKTRRDLAIMTIKFYFILVFLSGMVFKLDPEWSKVWYELAISVPMASLVLGVSGFFWGVHVLRTKQKKDK